MRHALPRAAAGPEVSVFMAESTTIQLAHDVERLQAEVAALRAERKLLVQSLEFHERDRQLVAFEIHDGIIQAMTAALMFLESAASHGPLGPAEQQEQYERGLRVLREAVQEARRLIRGLIPIELDERGLAASLGKLVEKFRADQGLEIDLRCQVQLDRLVPAVEMIALRIVQEALNNVWKHSQSSRAAVHLVQTGEEMEISVQDWGVGFAPDQTPSSRYGLAGIRERAKLLGGTASIHSQPGQGTRVTVHFTLRDSLLPPAQGDPTPQSAAQAI
jgi:signal transduction histidine kinase